MKILITGANGQLGNSIRNISGEFPEHEFLYTDIEDLDISSEKELDLWFNKHHPEFCVNCAAYTAVDRAEEDEKNAFLINSESVRLLAEASARYHSRFIHISTDYVFSGKACAPYNEDDETGPESVYGMSKLSGEKSIMDYDHVAIIRTSWLYSEFGKNFFKTMLKLMKEKDHLKVVFDQTGTPTWATDLARAVMKIIDTSGSENFTPGIYHFSNEGVASWYDFSKEIAKLSGSACEIMPVGSEEFPLPAPRPSYSVLNKALFKRVYKMNIPYWRDSVEKCYQEYITKNDKSNES